RPRRGDERHDVGGGRRVVGRDVRRERGSLGDAAVAGDSDVARRARGFGLGVGGWFGVGLGVGLGVGVRLGGGAGSGFGRERRAAGGAERGGEWRGRAGRAATAGETAHDEAASRPEAPPAALLTARSTFADVLALELETSPQPLLPVPQAKPAL